MRHMVRVVTTLALVLAAMPVIVLSNSQNQPQQTPAFRSSTELVLIDTHVVARDGSPIQGLKPEQFDVFIDGRRRAVVAAEFLRANETPATAATPPAGTGARPPREGRLIVLAVDQASFPPSAQASAKEAATRVLDYRRVVNIPRVVEK